jgi:hypothetical protein
MLIAGIIAQSIPTPALPCGDYKSSLIFLFVLFIREFFNQEKCDADNQQEFQKTPREDYPQYHADNEINHENDEQNIKPVHKISSKAICRRAMSKITSGLFGHFVIDGPEILKHEFLHLPCLGHLGTYHKN